MHRNERLSESQTAKLAWLAPFAFLAIFEVDLITGLHYL
jgi:hypothetical protein